MGGVFIIKGPRGQVLVTNAMHMYAALTLYKGPGA